MAGKELIGSDGIQNRIYTIRSLQVMFDRDLAILYKVEIKRLNEQVKRNIERFPAEFMFQLSTDEYDSLRSHFVTLKNGNPLRSQIATLDKADADKNFEKIFNAIEAKEIIPKQGIFFNGQIFDAYKFVSDLFRTAKQSIKVKTI